jgi:hypothetical protein
MDPRHNHWDMPFQQDIAFAEKVGQFFGQYHSTFRSDGGQVLAQLFVENNGWLVAHVSFPSGLKPEQVTDAYWEELRRYAKKHGFEGKLRILLSE